jgi:prolyl-tRNA synthetase
MVKIKKEKNFSEWYLETILTADLIDYGPVKGMIIFKPFAYQIWERIMNYVDKEIKKFGSKNVYFPIFIPESYLKKEKEHLEGFSPEVAVVTYAGGEELTEKLIVRPTSETIMYPVVSKWIKSYRDLPLIINQWANVIRWEKRPFPFFRNTEFLWHEGHGIHAHHRESLNLVLKVLKMYEEIYQKVFCLYGISGRKSESEKFAGALATYTYEILMPDGKALQACTSHDLGQNFSKVFEIRFQDKDQRLKFAWQNSWGLSTRSIGALIAVHGDDYGLVLPPKLSPYQIVIVPIYNKKNNKEVDNFINSFKENLKDYDFVVDNSEHTPGYKFNQWEFRGVPLRIEIGFQEIKSKKLTVFRRDKRERFNLKLDDLKNNLGNIFQDIERNLFERSKKFTEENTHYVKNYDEFKKVISKKRGFIVAFWCQNNNCEAKIKEETKATTRCLPLDAKKEKGKCIYCGKGAIYRWYFAQAH